MKTITRISLFTIALVLALAAMMSMADDRIARIEQSWNAGDQAATQQDFSRAAPREAAELGAQVNGRLKIIKAVRVSPAVYAARAEINGAPIVWIFAECPDNPRLFCFFGHRPASSITMGHAEAAQAADVVTTIIGITAFGAAEANPFGLAGAALIKASFLIGHRFTDFDACVDQRTMLDMMGYGPAVANLLTLAGAPIGVGLAAMAMTAYMRYEPALENAMYECAEFALNGNGMQELAMGENVPAR